MLANIPRRPVPNLHWDDFKLSTLPVIVTFLGDNPLQELFRNEVANATPILNCANSVLYLHPQ